MMISSIALLVHLILFKVYILHNDMIIKTTQKHLMFQRKDLLGYRDDYYRGFYYKGLYF